MLPVQAAGKADQRVKAALDKTGWKYEVDEDGDFKVGVTMKDGRTQLAYISSSTANIKGLEVRRITSPAYFSKGEFTATMANRLLKASMVNDFGAWQVGQSKGNSMAFFASKVDANMRPEDFNVALIVNLHSADQMEQELTGKDEF
jgi:hypothetical protein